MIRKQFEWGCNFCAKTFANIYNLASVLLPLKWLCQKLYKKRKHCLRMKPKESVKSLPNYTWNWCSSSSLFYWIRKRYNLSIICDKCIPWFDHTTFFQFDHLPNQDDVQSNNRYSLPIGKYDLQLEHLRGVI